MEKINIIVLKIFSLIQLILIICLLYILFLEDIDSSRVKIWIRDFKRITLNYRATSSYQHGNMYGTLLGPIRTKELNVLKIGLDCNVGKYPDNSVDVLREFLPRSNFTYIENDLNCVEKSRAKVDELFVYNRTNEMELVRRGPFDVIIDSDHKPNRQIKSFLKLWPTLKNNGIYFIEELQLSRIQEEISKISMIDWINKIVYDMLNNNSSNDINTLVDRFNGFVNISSTIRSVNCFRQACVLIKN